MGFLLSPTMCIVGISHIMQWKPFLLPLTKRFRAAASPALDLEWFTMSYSAQHLQSYCIHGLKHQFNKEHGFFPQSIRTVWITQICSTAHFLLLCHISLPLRWKSLFGCLIWLWRHQLASLHSNIPSWPQCFTDKQQVWTCLTTVLNSNLREEILLKIQPIVVDLLKDFLF